MTNTYLTLTPARLLTTLRHRLLPPRGSARYTPLAFALALAIGAGAACGALYAQEAADPPPAATVNINAADAATLAAGLNGVGLSRAEEIVRYREAYGPFATVEELAEVKGIGESTLEKNRSVITLD